MKKFLLSYDQPKKKPSHFSHQEAIFFDIRDAMLFEKHVIEDRKAFNTQIRPL